MRNCLGQSQIFLKHTSVMSLLVVSIAFEALQMRGI